MEEGDPQNLHVGDQDEDGRALVALVSEIRSDDEGGCSEVSLVFHCQDLDSTKKRPTLECHKKRKEREYENELSGEFY